MSSFDVQYEPIENCLSTMTQQATMIESALDDLMTKVAAAAPNFVGRTSESYQVAQKTVNDGLSNLKDRLTTKINKVHVIMSDNYAGTDRTQANRFGH